MAEKFGKMRPCFREFVFEDLDSVTPQNLIRFFSGNFWFVSLQTPNGETVGFILISGFDNVADKFTYKILDTAGVTITESSAGVFILDIPNYSTLNYKLTINLTTGDSTLETVSSIATGTTSIKLDQVA